MRYDTMGAAIRTFHWLIAKDRPRHHKRRYIIGCALSILCCTALGAAYLVLVPPTYTSEWSMILPGASTETRVALDRIGQAQSSAASPFSEKALNPKVNYKEIVISLPVLGEAARLMDLDPLEMSPPQVKLIDQTSIIEVKMTGPTPEEAQRRSLGIFEAFRKRLDHLREDELKSKNQAVRTNIAEVEVGLKQARGRLLELQTRTGLASLEQYGQLVASIEAMRRENAGARAALAEKRRQVKMLSDTIGLDVEQAAALIRISANPELRKIAAAHAAASATLSEMATRFGPSHPRAIDQRARVASTRDALKDLHPAELGNIPEQMIHQLLPSESERFLSLLTDYVTKNTELAGHVARVEDLERSLGQLDARRAELGAIAAQLDDLQRDHLIANAVFSSALARIDVGKSDHYASYPVVQLMSEPTMPDRASSPRLIFAVLGVVIGSIFSTLAWIFAWLHQWFLFQRFERRFLPTALQVQTANT